LTPIRYLLTTNKMICSTPAFVLKSFDFRETSKIATFFSRDFGKVKGILKGIRKDPKKFGSLLSPLSLNHIVFYRSRNTEIYLVGQCDCLDDFGLTRPDLKSFGYASYMSELVDALMPLEDPHKNAFSLMFNFLNTIKEGGPDTRLIFQIKILAFSGFKPHFDSCINCSSKIAGEAYFSRSRGGLLCPKCVRSDASADHVLKGTIATILYIERSQWAQALRLNMQPQVRKQLELILRSFIHFHIGRALKTDRSTEGLV
ncbi:MAG TPA: DNA repair protein RecO, partial [Candidatus Omnitrophota bacterium]|nr:DNA repair protein RecO [Candidatus Omnitrophota bacterium]